MDSIIVDLRNQFGPVRDQGSRQTCMAFAASAAHSFARGTWEHLSVEYAYYYGVQRSHGDRARGVSFPVMRDVLREDGQPLEAGWPYTPDLAATAPWSPPDDPGPLFHRDSSLLSPTVDCIYERLDDGQPLILVLNSTESLISLRAGDVVRASDERPVNNHAVVAVGYGETGGTRFVLVRNSWGEGWGDDGHGWVSEEYLDPRLLAVAKME